MAGDEEQGKVRRGRSVPSIGGRKLQAREDGERADQREMLGHTVFESYPHVAEAQRAVFGPVTPVSAFSG